MTRVVPIGDDPAAVHVAGPAFPPGTTPTKVRVGIEAGVAPTREAGEA